MGTYVLSIPEIQWALPRSVGDLLFGWNGLAKTIFFCVEFRPSIIFLFLLVINFIRNCLKNVIKDERA